MLPSNETLMRLERWAVGDPPGPQSYLTFGKSYVDYQRRGRSLTTLAIKFNRNVLLTTSDDREVAATLHSFERILRGLGWHTLMVERKTMAKLRSCLRQSQLPQMQEAKQFSKWLPPLTRAMKPFPQLDHSLAAINSVRLANAFELDGVASHVIFHEWRDGKGKTYHSVNGIYTSEDDAMMAYMKINKPAEYRIMEIGG